MRRILALLGLAFSVGCLNDPVVGSPTVTGPYTLRTVNGSALPYTIADTPASKRELVSHVITLQIGGTYADVRDVRTTANGQSTTERTSGSGSYTLEGTAVTLRSNQGLPQRVAQIKGNTMTFVEAGVTSVFTK